MPLSPDKLGKFEVSFRDRLMKEPRVKQKPLLVWFEEAKKGCADGKCAEVFYEESNGKGGFKEPCFVTNIDGEVIEVVKTYSAGYRGSLYTTNETVSMREGDRLIVRITDQRYISPGEVRHYQSRKSGFEWVVDSQGQLICERGVFFEHKYKFDDQGYIIGIITTDVGRSKLRTDIAWEDGLLGRRQIQSLETTDITPE